MSSKDTGGVWPTGIAISQSWQEVGALLWLCDHYKAVSFVELGILEGGLASFMAGRVEFAKSFRYLGIDKEWRFVDKKLERAQVRLKDFRLIQADVFDYATVMMVKRWVAKNWKPALIYCDNGNKPREFATYAKILRHGDLIAVHDYGIEYRLKDLERVVRLKRINSDWLRDTNIIAFERLNDPHPDTA